MSKYSPFIVLLLVVALAACKGKSGDTAVPVVENRQAKAMLQGIWIDSETEEVSFRIKGDTVYFPDSTSMPAYFRVAKDSFMLGTQSYPVVKQASHLFWFRNQNGDIIKLMKSDDPNDVLSFDHQAPPQSVTVTEVMKKDSVVVFNGERYHWYIAINPTRYKVQKTSYNDDGVGVENVYYDNIIHISLFHGADKFFWRDFRKQMYNQQVPAQFLAQAILSNMTYSRVDAKGFYFNAMLCIPDGPSCYVVETKIGFNGEVDYKLLEH